MKTAYIFLFCVIILSVCVSGAVVSDTIYYAAGSNTIVYVVDTAIINAVSSGSTQINFSGYMQNDWVYSSRGELIYSPSGLNTSLVSFSDGKYYLIYDVAHHFPVHIAKTNLNVQSFCKQTYTIYILLGILIIVGIAGTIITIMTSLSGDPMYAVMSAVITGIMIVIGLIITASICGA